MNKYKGYSKVWILVLLLVSFLAGCARNDTIPLITDKAITSYSFGGIAGIINEAATPKTIAVTMPYGTDVTVLTAAFTTTGTSVTVSGVEQVSGTTANNFTTPVAYIVTAEDNSTATYNVTVTVSAISAKAITSYSFGGVAGAIDEGLKTIVVTMPYGTDVTALAATFTSTGQGKPTVSGVEQTSGATSNDFTGSVAYIVTAQDNSTATYNVTVTVTSASAKAITSYSIGGVAGAIDEGLKTIVVTMPYGTDVTALAATFTSTGQGKPTVSGVDQTSNTTVNDFTTPVPYIVTAQDNSTANYNVTVTVAATSDKAITSYAFGLVAGAIDEGLKTIVVTMPYGTDVTALAATFTSTGQGKPTVSGVEQTSGATSNDFTGSVAYIVTAQDNSTATYNVTVTVTSASAKAITSYSIGGVAGVINELPNPKTITVIMPAGTDPTTLNALTAKFTTTGLNVKVTGVTQVSENTVNDFTPPPVAYIVTAQDTSTATYNVTVTIAANSDKAITSYKFGGVAGAIDETAKTIVVTMPYGTDVTALMATFTSTGQGNPTVSGVEQTSGTTSNDFTIPVDYIVTAEDTTFATYNVTVIVPLGINLRGAASFGIAAQDGLTSTGVTVINGDVALYPTATCTDATGAPGGGAQSCLVKTYASVTGMTVNGSIYWAGDPFDNGGTANAVSNDLNIAWVEGKNKVDTFATGFLVGELGASGPAGKILLPGVYHEAALGLAAGNVATFDAQNDANAIFIIKVDSSFTDSGILGNLTEIKLANGAQARNIWFVAGLDITIGSGTTWNGNILAGRDATINDGSTVNGRVLAGASGAGAMTLTGAASPSVTTISVPQ